MCNTKEILIKYLSENVPELTYVNGVSDWVDLSVAEDVEMKKGEYRILKLGVAIQLPKGYEAIVAPRSSTFKRYKILLSNSIGVIDETYCGDNDEWGFPAYAMEDTFIPKGTRICQFRIIEHQPTLMFTKVETLNNEGRGGFGSTGR